MFLRKFLFFTAFSCSVLLGQNSIGGNVNNEDVEVRGSIDISALSDYSNGTTYLLNASYMHSDDDNLVTLGLSGQNSLQGTDGLTLSLGLKVVFADEYLASPFVAEASYLLPFIDRIPPTSLVASIAYAPSVLCFRDAKNYSEFRFEADMEVISNIHIYTGYRNIDTDHENFNQNFNDSFYAGLKLSF